MTSPTAAKPRLDVCAGVVLRDGRYLLARRPHGSHLAGAWEFPGGKVRADETRADCIRRELHEELGLDVLDSSPLTTIEHEYPEKAIRLHFLACRVAGHGQPCGREGQEWGWFRPDELGDLGLAPADRRFVVWLQDAPPPTPPPAPPT